MRTTFRGLSGSHVLVLTYADDQVCPAFSRRARGSAASRLLETIGTSYGEERVYPRAALLGAAAEFAADLDRERDLLPYRYSFRVEHGDTGGPRSGGFGGFRINGKHHAIWSGPGVCYLEELGVGPDGRGFVARTIDVRGERRVETDDHGPIWCTAGS